MGAGAFPCFAPRLRFTAPDLAAPSMWLLPEWFHPEGRASALSYHGDLSRWWHTNGGVVVTRSFRSIGPNVWERILKAPGDIRHGYWAVSSDGKMLVITGFGKDPKGQDYYFHRVLERQ